uniref:Uncharacterized protein n=1 Tax=Rhizophora mucronata TaxID=61149 RepID=A0A2P2PB30_RHIMU
MLRIPDILMKCILFSWLVGI